ncbi:MAG: right-handed parallel beta-helix repeat-containing protein [Thermoplasmata archaeon]|nr:right-handed parallel beta-helix repeat-containing protein [Thermoplasmata archaeon]
MRIHGIELVVFVAVGALSLAFLTTAFTQNNEQELREGVLEVGEGYEFPSIQIAIDSAAEGSTIVVHQGEYHERLFIHRGITLEAAPGESFHLAATPQDPGPPGIRGASLTIASSTPVTVDGGTYSYSGTSWNDAAIKIQYGSNHIIKNAEIKNSKQGVWIHGGDKNVALNCNRITVYNNTIHDISGHGIYIQRTYAYVSFNTIYSCGEGIMVAHGYTSSNAGGVWANTIHNSTVGVFVEKDRLPKLEQNTFTDCEYGVYLNQTTSRLNLKGNSYYRCTNGTFYLGTGPILNQERYYNCTTGVLTSLAGSGRVDIYSTEIHGSIEHAINLAASLYAQNLRVIGRGGILLDPGVGGSVTIQSAYVETSSDSLRVLGNVSVILNGVTLNSTSRSFLSEGVAHIDMDRCTFISHDNAFEMAGGGSLTSDYSSFTSFAGRALILSDVSNLQLQRGYAYSDGAQVVYLLRCNGVILDSVNISGGGGVGVFLKETERVTSINLTIDGSLSEGIIISGDSPEFIRHTIPGTNTFGGKPIFYLYGGNGDILNLTDKGEVIIAGTSDSMIREEGCYPGSTWILGSQNLTFLNSSLERGLHTIDSSEIVGYNITLGPSLYSGASLLMVNSTLRLFNSTLSEGMASYETFYLSRSSSAHFYNTSYAGSGDMESSLLILYHLIGLKVFYSDGAVAPGAEYLLNLDNTTFRATSLFSGVSPPTDDNGTAGPWWVPHITLNDSSAIEHSLFMTVNATEERSWQEERGVNTSYDHVEVFRTADIRAPMVPTGLEAHAVEGKDEILLTWNTNVDDTALYRVYLVGDTLELLEERDSPPFRDVGVENGTSRTYRVSAVDEAGIESELSSPVTAVARDYIPPERPSDLWVEGYGGTNATLTWTESTSNDVVIYRVFVAEGIRQGGGIEGFSMVGETTGKTFEVHDLLPETEYTFTVLAYDEAGNPSLPAPMAYITTLDITWPVVSNLTWSVELYQVTVEWDTDQVTKGTLYLGTSTDNMVEHREEDYNLHHTVVVDRLAHNATYYFYVYSEEPSGNNVTDDNSGEYYTFKTPPFEGYLRIVLSSSRDGSPVEGATVRAAGRSAQVGLAEVSPGVYSATLEPGPWTISINAEGFISPSPFDIEVNILQWTNLTRNLTPAGPPLCNLTVRIVDEDGNGISGATVTYNGREYTADEGGRVYLGDVPSNASYTITVKGEGFNKRSVKIDIPYGEEGVEEKITLKKEGGGGGSLLWVVILLLVVAGVIGAVLFVRRKKGGGETPQETPQEEKPEVKSGKV